MRSHAEIIKEIQEVHQVGLLPAKEIMKKKALDLRNKKILEVLQDFGTILSMLDTEGLVSDELSEARDKMQTILYPEQEIDIWGS